MTISKFLQQAGKLELQPYKKPRDIKNLKKNCIAFSGSPLKHPFDKGKVILVADPYSSNTFYYEFKREDISVIEELPSLSGMDGESITMARLWIKKMSVAIRSTPFVVEDINEISAGTG